jgi:hypothetical protein
MSKSLAHGTCVFYFFKKKSCFGVNFLNFQSQIAMQKIIENMLFSNSSISFADKILKNRHLNRNFIVKQIWFIICYDSLYSNWYIFFHNQQKTAQQIYILSINCVTFALYNYFIQKHFFIIGNHRKLKK